MCLAVVVNLQNGAEMTRFLFKRLIQIFITLFLFLTLIFFMINAQPGDISDFYSTNPQIPADERLKIKESFGLNQPLWKQYTVHIKNFFSGNLGVSFSLYPRSVVDIIKERLPRTLVLFITAAVISFYMGFALGKIIAWKRGGLTEYVSTLGGVTLYTVFTPWFGLMIIWLFAFKAGWFPIGMFLDPLTWRDASVSANHVFNNMLLTALVVSLFLIAVFIVASRVRMRKRGWLITGSVALSSVVMLLAWSASGTGYLAFDILRHMVLPVGTLTLISFAGTMLLTRNSMLETMREDYVFAARAKGLSDKVVRDKHVARNALLPVVTYFVLSIAFAIDGGVVIETIFSWPGMGQTLVSAVTAEDLPLAVGAFVFTGIFVLIAHLAADILYAFLDPRIRY